MRTTIDIDDPILKDLKRMQRREGKSLGRLVSDLLAQAMSDAEAKAKAPSVANFRWLTQTMGARVDLADKDALHDAMDGPGP
ncbi:MAG TPA: antitoxin [Casimicrobiaceae bacterium]|nr:antitoxin [Casimicrobiaceae bacterium]